jgi:Cof subfamily protein (haloacid dehalogenase superfamily)
MTAGRFPPAPEHGWRLVISDLDGTMLDENGRISPENIAAVAELAEHGIGFTIATGRLEVMAQAFISQLMVRLPVISCNGAIIRDTQTGNVLYKSTLQTGDVLELTDWLVRHHLDYLCYTPEQVYYPANSRRIERFHRYNEIAAETGINPVPLVLLDEGSDQLLQNEFIKVLAILPEPEDHQAMAGYLGSHPSLGGVLSWADAMDITAAGINKGRGLVKLAEILGISTSEIVAFGDNDNDVALLSTAGLGIAMDNASEAAIAVSQLITDSHRQSGVAAGIRKYILPTIASVSFEK